MAGKKSFMDADGPASVSQDLIAASMIALDVEEKPGEWDPQTRTTAQKTDSSGTPQWILHTLVTPIEGDKDHRPEVVPITLTAANAPAIQSGRPVRFVNLHTWTYVRKDREGHVTGIGRSFSADGFRQQQAEGGR